MMLGEILGSRDITGSERVLYCPCHIRIFLGENMVSRVQEGNKDLECKVLDKPVAEPGTRNPQVPESCEKKA